MLAVFAALLFAQAAPLQSTLVNPSALPSAPAIALDPAARQDVSVNTRALGDALLEAQMRAYFASEKKAAWWWAGTGVTALLVGGALGGANTDASQGASYPLLDISVVQLAGAIYLFWTNGDRVVALSDQLANHRCQFLAEESARMRRLDLRLAIAQPIEALALVAGAGMAGWGATQDHKFLEGAGFGLIAQSVITLVFDQFASARSQTYSRALQAASRAHASECAP